MTFITETYSDRELEIIEELRNRFDDMKPDLFEDTRLFYRFLKARDFNLNLAEAMLRKHMAWRKEFKVDTIRTEFNSPEVLVKYFPTGFIGYDKDGCTVQYLAVGNMDPKGLRKAAKFPDMMRHVIQGMEIEVHLMKEQSSKVGKEMYSTSYICDLKNFGFSVASDKKALEHVVYLAKIYQDNYPERLKTFYFINVSPYFTFAFNIIKSILSASVIQKICFCSGEDYKQQLLKVIDADVLPAFLGGKRTDPDGNPLCLTFVNHAGPVPEKYFVNKNKMCLTQKKDAKKLIVPRSSFSEIEVEIDEVDSMLEWEFETKTRDIGFGLFYKEGDTDQIAELVPLQRLDTEDFSETGICRCEKTGTYIILFDNSYSWLRSKEIYYRAAVRSPKALEQEEMPE